jgi:multiple sugar transport system substrate-binding protein
MVLMIGCSAGGNNTGNANGPSGKKVNLVFWIFENPPMVEQTKRLVEAFQQEYPHITVDLQAFPNNQFTDKLTVALGTKTGPDVFLISDRTLPAMIAKGVLAPVVTESFGFAGEEEMKAAWIEGSLDGLMNDGKIYSIPMEFNTFSLFVNKKAFAEAGLDPVKDAPKTWDELAEIAKKLTIRDAGGNLIRAGFAFPMFNGGWNVLAMDPMVKQLGGAFIEDFGTEAYFDSPEVKQVFQTWYDLYFTHRVTDIGFGTSSTAAPNQSFIDGQTAMWLSGPWAIPQITEGTAAYDNYAVVPLPQYNPDQPVNMLYGWNWAVNGVTDHPAESWQLVDYLSGRQEEWLQSSGYIQPRKGWMESDIFRDFPFAEVWKSDMEHGRYVMRSEKYAQLADIVGRAVDAVMKSGTSIDEALAQAQAEAVRVLQE